MEQCSLIPNPRFVLPLVHPTHLTYFGYQQYQKIQRKPEGRKFLKDLAAESEAEKVPRCPRTLSALTE
jgi:hypothetical protein